MQEERCVICGAEMDHSNNMFCKNMHKQPIQRIKSGIKMSIIADIDSEFTRATSLHPKFNSRHEGLAILEEEMHELRMEVYKNHSKTPEAKILQRKEAVQVAAMAMRFIYDCCDDTIPNSEVNW